MLERRSLIKSLTFGFAAPAIGTGVALLPARQAKAQARKLTIVATTGMIADAVRQVAGSHANVQALMAPGVDPHLYRQTRVDIVAMSRADAVFWHGLRLEAQLEPFLKELGRRKPVAALGEAVPADRLLADEEFKDKHDPHVWMDPRLWLHVVEAARRELTKLAPAEAAAFAANAARHAEEVGKLALYADEVLQSVAPERRVLVSAHDAFAYFGRAYSFVVEGIQGISTESEAGLRRIEELVRLVVERKIPAVFVESSVSERNVQALVEGARARGHQLAIGGELFSDAMGPEGTYEGSYIGMIDHNVTTIARALGGSAPLAGALGRLTRRS